jgi:hypothetical protein
MNIAKGFGVTAVTLVSLLGAAPAFAALQGPVYPAPGGNSFSSTGTSEGAAGGINASYSGINLAPLAQLYWGPQAGSVQVSLTGNSSSSFTTLNFDSTVSNLAGGVARWTATGVPYSNPTPGGLSGPLKVRFTVTQLTPATNAIVAAPSDIASVGAVVNVKTTGSAYSLNWIFEAEYPPGSNTWVPVDTLSQLTPGSTNTSFNGGFFFANATAGVPAVGPMGALLLSALLAGCGLLVIRRRRSRTVDTTVV